MACVAAVRGGFAHRGAPPLFEAGVAHCRDGPKGVTDHSSLLCDRGASSQGERVVECQMRF
jgi:hypothetical protein